MHEPNECESCGTEIAPGLLACPGCHRLVHGGRLKELAASAEEAERAGDVRAALVDWREALELLPAGTRQHEHVEARISALGRRAETTPGPVPAPEGGAGGSDWSGKKAGLAGLGAVGLFLLKFKFAIFFLLTKAKFLLLGLTKASTFLSMFASFGVYWTVFGWQFGAGAGPLDLRARDGARLRACTATGSRPTAPMFIPGLGALIRLKQALTDVRAGRAGGPGRARSGAWARRWRAYGGLARCWSRRFWRRSPSSGR